MPVVVEMGTVKCATRRVDFKKKSGFISRYHVVITNSTHRMPAMLPHAQYNAFAMVQYEW